MPSPLSLSRRLAGRRCRLGVEQLECRVTPSIVEAHVFDPLVEPGQKVHVTWRIEREYLDQNSNGQIEDNEADDLEINLDIPGVVTPPLQTFFSGENYYLEPANSPNAGDLRGFYSFTMPAETAPGSYDLWITASRLGTNPITRRVPGAIQLRTGQNAYPRTLVTWTIDSADTSVQVHSAQGFPSSGQFKIRIDDEILRVTGGAGTTAWTIERGVDGSTPALHWGGVFAAEVSLDQVDSFVSRYGLGSVQDLEAFALSLSSTGSLDYPAQDFLKSRIALQEIRTRDALNAFAAGNLTNLPVALPVLLEDAFGGEAHLHEWDPSKPTIILVHGIENTYEDHFQRGAEFQAAVAGQANVLSFYWGAGNILGTDRTVDALLDFYFAYREQRKTNLDGAVRLNSLLRLLTETYSRAGKDPQQNINIVAHSQGTVVITAALILDAPKMFNGLSQDVRINHVLFIGSNLSRAATDPNADIDRIQANVDCMTNLFSGSEDAVSWGWPQGAGYQGFDNPDHPKIKSLDGMNPNLRPITAGNQVLDKIEIRHGDPWLATWETVEEFRDEYNSSPNLDSNPLDIGWWSWLLFKQQGDGFLTDGLQRCPWPTTATVHGAAPRLPVFYPALDLEFGSRLVAAMGSQFDFPVGGFQLRASTQVAATPQSPPTFTGFSLTAASVFRGDLVVVEAQGVSDPDGDAMRMDVFRDLNSNLQADPDEYICSDFNPAGGFRTAISTTDFGIGTHTLLVVIVDQRNYVSVVRSASVEVAEPGAPPPVLPASLPAGTQPHYRISPHRNGDIFFSSDHYSLVAGRADIWELTPQNGGSFTFSTSGATDTVLGLYDQATGALLAFDEDNGPGVNAQVSYPLATGTTYLLVVVSQRSSWGNYGLDVTGINQTLTATLVTPSPLYRASQAESISQVFELDYYELLAPAGATSLDVLLDVSAGLDGWVRVEDATGQTIATSFLAGAGSDDLISSVAVIAGQTYYVTVMGLSSTTGGYTLNVDFNPDDPSLPDQLTPLPGSWTPLVPLPDGSLLFSNQNIAAAGQFLYYLISPEQTGTYTFETFGGLDTQLGLYLGNGFFLQKDDDSGAGTNARITATLNGGDDYYVVVRAEDVQTGAFDLQTSGPAGTPGLLTPQGLDSSTSSSFASIANNNRYLYYQTTAPSQATSLDLTAEVSSGTPGLNVSLRLSDSEGNILGFADSQGAGGSEQLNGIAVQPGETYFITLYGEGLTTGDARVLVDFEPNPPVTSGAAFPVNTSTFGGQEFPAVGRSGAGSVVVWSNSDFGRVDAQRFDANGQPVGSEFQVNVANLNGITRPVVAVAADGSFAVVWTESGNLYLRRFDSSGNPTTGDVQVNTSAGVSLPQIAVAPSGQFWVIWSASGDIYRRRFDAAGSPLEGEILVNSTTVDGQFDPDIAVASDGSALAVWTSEVGSSYRVFGQAFDAAGSPVGSEFQVSEGTTGSRFGARLAISGDGTRMVVWRSMNQDGSGWGVYARRLDASNAFLGSEFRVNTATSGDQTDPDVAAGSDGKFLVAWQGADASGTGIISQQFGVGGVPLGTEALINQQENSDQARVAVAGDGTNRFLVVWNSDGQDGSIWGVFGRQVVIDSVVDPELQAADSVGAAADRYLNFGVFPLGAGAVDQTVQITNTGNAPLSITGLEIYGADATAFALDDASDFALAPAQSRLLTVTFSSAQPGVFYAALRFSHNDTDVAANPYWISLLAEIDIQPPDSTVMPLPTVSTSPSFTVSWSGSDDGAGVASFDVFVSSNGGPFAPWLDNTTQTSAVYSGVLGGEYAFYSVTTDNVGNVQPTPASAQATTRAGSGNMTLRRNSSNWELRDTSTNTLILSQALADPTPLVITDPGSQNNSLTIDFVSGGFFALPAGSQFNAGGGTDTLRATGNVHFTLSNTALTSGTFSLGLSGINQASLTGGASANTLDASAFSAGPVTLSGGSGSDVLKGGSGSDLLTGGPGNDIVQGGAGIDRLVETAAGYSRVVFTLKNTSLRGLGTDSLSSIERARLTGTTGNDSINARYFSGWVTLLGGAGKDTLTGGAAPDVLVGSSGNDLLTGNNGRDLLIGGNGADTLKGGASDDILIAPRTKHDANVAALDALMREWTRTSATYNQRTYHLRSGGGLNVPYYLNSAAFLGDATAVDVLTGGTGLDWFLVKYNSDQFRDRASTEKLTWTR